VPVLVTVPTNIIGNVGFCGIEGKKYGGGCWLRIDAANPSYYLGLGARRFQPT